MNKHFDFCILGAGITGIHLSMELVKTGASVCVLDPRGIARGGSGAPLGLANPATGRFATKTWNAEKCLPALEQNLEIIQEHVKEPFYKKSGILRPAMDKKIATKMKNYFETTEWPEGWIEWLDEKEMQELHPGISCVNGGVWVPVGLVVNMKEYVMGASAYLQSKNVEYIVGEPYSVFKNEDWEIELSSDKITATNIIFTAGAWIKSTPFWRDVPVIPVKGQTLLMRSSTPLPFSHAVSALGYVGSLDGRNYVIGSTYEHQFDNEFTDDKAEEYLLERSNKVIPGLNSGSVKVTQWASVRASTPNRMPIMGAHEQEENCFVFTGLGSKGLLYSAYLAKEMTEHILHQKPLPEEVHVSRFKK